MVHGVNIGVLLFHNTEILVDAFELSIFGGGMELHNCNNFSVLYMSRPLILYNNNQTLRFETIILLKYSKHKIHAN